MPRRTHWAENYDSPSRARENRIVQRCMEEFGISREVMAGVGRRWRQQHGSRGSERNSLAPHRYPVTGGCEPDIDRTKWRITDLEQRTARLVHGAGKVYVNPY